MMNQRSAVFAAVTAVMGEPSDSKVSPNKDQLKEIHALVVDAFKTGQVELKDASTRNAEWIARYVPGLVNNWLRKDERLNGGGKYQPKNPGSRPADESMKAMRALLAITIDPSQRAEIEAAMEQRKTELHPKVELKIDALPPALRRFVPTT